MRLTLIAIMVTLWVTVDLGTKGYVWYTFKSVQWEQERVQREANRKEALETCLHNNEYLGKTTAEDQEICYRLYAPEKLR